MLALGADETLENPDILSGVNPNPFLDLDPEVDVDVDTFAIESFESVEGADDKSEKMGGENLYHYHPVPKVTGAIKMQVVLILSILLQKNQSLYSFYLYYVYVVLCCIMLYYVVLCCIMLCLR